MHALPAGVAAPPTPASRPLQAAPLPHSSHKPPAVMITHVESHGPGVALEAAAVAGRACGCGRAGGHGQQAQQQGGGGAAAHHSDSWKLGDESKGLAGRAVANMECWGWEEQPPLYPARAASVCGQVAARRSQMRSCARIGSFPSTQLATSGAIWSRLARVSLPAAQGEGRAPPGGWRAGGRAGGRRRRRARTRVVWRPLLRRSPPRRSLKAANQPSSRL